MNINSFYKDLLKDLQASPLEMNKRTGIATRSLPGITFQTDIETEGFPLLALRKMPTSFIAEQIWFISGSNNIGWLSKHTKIWDSFAEEDGLITSAYGYRWRHWWKCDQLLTVLDKLKKDPSTRHGVLIMWAPDQDLIVPQKNVPCPVMFTLNIIGGRLHMHLIIRSNDMVLGAPTDIAGFALLQLMLAQELNVQPGIYTHSISNAHFYENQAYVVEELLLRPINTDKVLLTLPLDSYKRAVLLEDSLVGEIKANINNYHPEAAILGIPIAI